MRVIQYKFKKFSKIVTKLCIFGEIPIYNSKFSNRIFTNIQHIFLLVAKINQWTTIQILPACTLTRPMVMKII